MFRLKTAFVPITLVLLLALALAGCRGMAKRPDVTPEQPTPLSVMTYNVYVGARTDALLASQDLEQLPLGVAEMYNTVLVSDFPGRAAAIARIVKETQPHLIGLQEISLLRTQTPGDVLFNRQPNAETVALDFLEVLLGALWAEGLSYTVAGQVENFDLEMPMAIVEEELVVDVRLTDYDVLLARGDVEIANPVAVNYQLELPLPHLGITVPRGYVAVDATVEGTTYRVVNTHLESFIPAVRAGQAQELVASLSAEARPVVLLGDFNTQAPAGDVYQFLLDAAGYTDVWQADSEGAGYTCCQAGDLRNAESALDQRIDLIFTRGVSLREGVAIRTVTVGDRAADQARAGVWPSDHAGVVAYLPVE